MYKSIPLDEFYCLINHGPCVFITSGTIEKANIAPVAWNMPINNDPPLVAIAVAHTHYTAELIKQSGEFVINIPDLNMMKRLFCTGKISGRKEDKIKKFNIKLSQPLKSCNRKLIADYKTPHIGDISGYIECSVFAQHIYDEVILFVGKVLYAAVKRDMYDEYLIPEKSPSVHHLGGDWFALAEKRIKIVMENE